MAGKGKMRVKREGDKGHLLALIRHPQETGLRIDKQTGRKIPAHFVQTVEITVNGSPIVTGQLGTAISENPYIGVTLRHVRAGDLVELYWRDNRGESGTIKTTVK